MAAQVSKGLQWALLITTIAVAAAAVGSGPFGPDGPLDTVECYIYYAYIMQAVLIYFAVCTLRCEDDDCRIVCVRRFLVLLVILQIAFLLCIVINIFL
jgi:hypothetical protein